MLRKLFKEALDKLKVCTEEELKNNYQLKRVKNKPDGFYEENKTKKQEAFELNVLLKNIDNPFMTEELEEKYIPEDIPEDIQALIKRIDAKLMELECKENYSLSHEKSSLLKRKCFAERAISQNDETSACMLINDLAPLSEHSLLYCFEYFKTVLYCLVNMENVDLSAERLNSKAKSANIMMQNDSLITIYWGLLDLVKSLHLKDEQNIQQCIYRVKRKIRIELQECTRKKEFDFGDLVQIRIYRDILFLVLSVSKYTANHNGEQNQNEALAYVYYYLADNFYKKKESSVVEGLYYAKQGLALTDPLDRQDAFNTLGVCAVDTRGNKQLAYDAYYSWINRAPVGMIVELVPDYFSFEIEDEIWRQEKAGRERTAVMYGNFSYTCGVIADTYEPRTKRWDLFINKAVAYIEEAICLQDVNETIVSQLIGNYYCTWGTLLTQLNKPDSSFQNCIEKYQKYYCFSNNRSDKLSAARILFEVTLDDSLSKFLNECKNDKNYQTWLSDNKHIYERLMQAFDSYKKELNNVKEDITKEEREKKVALEPFFELQEKLKNVDSEIKFALIMILHLAVTIKVNLKRHEYSRLNYFTRSEREDAGISTERSNVGIIAYYTTLKTATYLFNVLYRNNSCTAPEKVTPDKEEKYKKGKNCLTMMHAHYMNDPNEGLVLGNCVGGNSQRENILFYNGDTAHFREDIFERYFVFLKSFTDRIDDLLMWNRYSSDRNSGSRDSNGCFIQFNTDSFDKVNNSDRQTKNKLLLDVEDDYALYRVVYISKDGRILKEKNRGLSKYVKLGYEMLVGLLRVVNDYLNNRGIIRNEDEQVVVVRKFVQSALREVLFLFKDDDYADESEYRLIVSRTHKQLDCINMISGDPDKVSINPYFQMCIDRVILGPNVDNADSWITYFRYNLSKMWRRTLELEGKVKEPEFAIERSKIHYHT